MHHPSSASIREYALEHAPRMYREPSGRLRHPYLVPGSAQYNEHLWDWDSWLTNVALRELYAEDVDSRAKLRPYERGCIMNWLDIAKANGCTGWIPYVVGPGGADLPADPWARNMHKPCLAQHAAFLVRKDGDIAWLREDLMYIGYFLNNYLDHHRHACGLLFWQNDDGIGVDNDPCTFDRPPRSSGSVFLNCMMVMELQSHVYLLETAGLDSSEFRGEVEKLTSAIQNHCWDERDGFFYNADFCFKERHPCKVGLHAGRLRAWDSLPMRIGIWSGFLALWSGVATEAQAERLVREHYGNPDSFCAAYGVRTLDKRERMYSLRASGNPSPWTGPIWGVSNYLIWEGLRRYGYENEARELGDKTLSLFGSDLERHGELHECYEPDSGEPITCPGFQNWNLLALKMAAISTV
ncbi:MAG: glycoside hydrolase family 37 [Kiritimatiellae bacterium]|nr:glycoside hydrolase family 37 [Kiritimatiellia bacterium]